MPFIVPVYNVQRTPEPVPEVRVVAQSDVTWDRPVFKAPPLEIAAPVDSKAVVDEIRRSILFR
jgi:hypothetical protein